MAGFPWIPCSPLTGEEVNAFFRDGFIVLRGLFAPEVIDACAGEATAELDADEGRELSGRAFGRVALERTMGLWQRSPKLRALTLDERLARIARDLLHVDGVRMIGDDVFRKPPGGRVTTWHTDAAFVTIDRDQFLSVWIPFRPVSASCGAIVYAAGTHRDPLPPPPRGLGSEALSQHWYAAHLRTRKVRTVVVDAAPGDVLIHHARTLHMAQANASDVGRLAFGIHYVDARSRLVEPRNVMHHQTVAENGWNVLRPGDELDVASAPVVFHR